MRGRIFTVLFLSLVLAISGCGEKGPKNYTIEQFMDNVTVTGGAFSHDEDELLLSTDRSGVFNAWTVPVGGGEARQLTTSETHSIFALSFFPHDDRVLYLSDKGGNEIYHIYMRDEDGNVTDLTPFGDARSIFYGWTHDLEHFIYGSNKRDSKYMDVYLMDVETLRSKMIYLNEAGYNFGWISDDLRYLSFTKTVTRNDSDMYLYDRKAGRMKHITKHEGDINYTPLDFCIESKCLYFLTDEGREFHYLRKYEIETGKTETVETAEWDITYSYFSWNGKYRVTAINNDARTQIKVYDTETGQELELPHLPDGEISSVGFSRSERYLRFYVSSATSTNNLYVYDFETGAYVKLTDSMNPEIDPADLVDAEVVRYPSFDGEMIPAIYYKPHGTKKDEKIPALVLVHGGPGGQSTVRYSELTQYLVNHGYAVLAVNNRGSSGYGKRFYALDDKRHGVDDLQDCVEGKKWLIETGYIDPDRIGIIGGSYGGYMVLAALAFQPEQFAAGVDLFGISNWIRTLESIPSWWESYRQALYREMGDPEADRDYLRSISPLFHAGRIVKPLMVLQGANDPRVLKVESDEIVSAVRENGVVVEYMVFDDEGHGFRKKENRAKGYVAIHEFLDINLKN